MGLDEMSQRRMSTISEISEKENYPELLRTATDQNSNCKMWQNHSSTYFKELAGIDKYNIGKTTQFQNPAEWFPKLKLESTITSLQSYLGLKAFCLSKRGSHAYGVGAKGHVTFDPDPKLPGSTFFKRGKHFEARVRFANVRVDDDAMLDGRSVAIKFRDSDYESPFDLVMETGRIAPFNNLVELKSVLYALSKGGNILKTHCLKKPIYYETLIEMARRNPDSYGSIHYYGQQNYRFYDDESGQYIARFRCIPSDGQPESGLLSAEEQKQVWNLGRLPGETRSKTYLRDEMKKRLQNETVNMTIQVQLYDWSLNLPDEVYNCSTEWPEEEHPWMNIGHLTIDESMDDNTIESTRMDIANKPSCLDFFGAKSIYDYNSIPYARLRVYPVSQALRSIRNNLPNIMCYAGAATAFYAIFKYKFASLLS